MGRPKNCNREGVLEKVLHVFWKRGFADASLHELEVATGVNKSGLYSEFEDKEDLFVQSLRYYLENVEKRGLLTTEPSPMRPIGMVDTIRAIASTGCRVTSGVSVGPGLRPFARIRRAFSSTVHARTKLRMAALVAP